MKKNECEKERNGTRPAAAAHAGARPRKKAVPVSAAVSASAPQCVRLDRAVFEELRQRFNCREWAHPDPVEILYDYPDVADREIAALVAASLAYGRVDQILRDARDAMDRMGRAPARFLERHSEAEIGRSFHGFCHRWTKGEDMAALLAGIRGLQRRHGSLGACFRRAWNLHPNTGTVHEALIHFVRELKEAGRTAAVRGGRDLLPEVQQGGASKRLHLFLRWMIRSDEIDPGGWEGIPASALIIPLDTHMHRIGRALGFTRRRQTDAKTAEEITAAFRQIAPEDPVRYDFALTRLGIHPDASAPPWLRL